MKLLIITQVVDTQHSVLGFFHRWIEEFASQCEKVTVICLEKGEYSLPENVKVLSLGKEEGKSKLKQLSNFYSFIFRERQNYDAVFVHMNQIYVLLGALFWRLSGKRVGLWYMHGSTPLSLKLALPFTHYIFSGSKESFRLKNDKLFITGHGIDINLFQPAKDKVKDIDLITVGRITEAKNIITLLNILIEVNQSIDVSLTIVGAAVTGADKQYEKELLTFVTQNGLQDKVHFLGKITQTDLPYILKRAKLFVTAATNGSLDKAVLEAMACGLPVVSMAPGTASLPLGENQVSDHKVFANRILCELKEPKNILKYHFFIASEHSLSILVPKIISSYGYE